MKRKRNVISDARKKALALPNIVYTIRCPGTQCDCQQHGADCRRGFFSLWIQAVYGRYFGAKLKIPSYVDFGDKPYLYSDPATNKGDLNFWNYYYVQEPPAREKRRIPNDLIETYPLRIWNRNHYRKVFFTAVENLKLQARVASYMESLLLKVRADKTLGIHIRGTDHSDEVPEVSIEKMMRLLRKRSRKYQKIFVATDDHLILPRLEQEFGKDRLIYQEAVRSKDQQAVHTNMKHPNRYRLGLEVLTDCYALSVCDEVILVHSNVSYGALLLNPDLNYTLLETSSYKRKRYLTGFLYTMDRWGIRKM